MKFDNKKKSGIETCVYCKSEDIWREIVWEKGKKYKILRCSCMSYSMYQNLTQIVDKKNRRNKKPVDYA